MKDYKMTEKLSVKEALEQGKFEYYRTRDGRYARVLHKLNNSSKPFLGYIIEESYESECSWSIFGNFISYVDQSGNDLVEYIGPELPKEKWEFECYLSFGTKFDLNDFKNENDVLQDLFKRYTFLNKTPVKGYQNKKVRVKIEVIE